MVIKVDAYSKEDIFKLIDEGFIIVTPTELSARALAVDYVATKKKGVFSSQIINFGEFIKKGIPDLKGLKEVSLVDKEIFSFYFFSNFSEHLKYYKTENKEDEITETFPNFILDILSSLKGLERKKDEIKIKELKSDLALIEEKYIQFLEKNNLYDTSYINLDFSSLKSFHFLLFPSSSVQEREKLEFLEKYENIGEIVPMGKVNGELLCYKNEKEEDRSLFLKLRNLIDKDNVSLDQIAISCSSLERVKPYLEFEAKLFNIKISCAHSEKLIETIPGSFLSAIFSLKENGYRNSEMKAFFLNPSLSFKEKKKINTFIHSSLDFNIESSGRGEDKYAILEKGKEDAFKWTEIRRYIEDLAKEKEPEKFRSLLNTLISKFFGEEKLFSSSLKDSAIFSFILSSLDNFVEKSKEDGMKSYLTNIPFSKVFISYLKNERYAFNENRENGIRVFNFGEDSSISYKYHFLINLNEKESKISIKEGKFLSEFERSNFSETDLTDSVLSSYFTMSENVFLSVSEETHSSAVLPLVTLLEKKSKGNLPDADPYLIEDSDNREKILISPLQKKGYERAKLTSFKAPEKNRKGIKKVTNPSLSYTLIDSYLKCPFYYALEYEYGLKNKKKFELTDQDYLEIGIVLHRIFEFYFKRIIEKEKNGLDITIDFNKVFDDEMKAWINGEMTDGLREDLSSHYKKIENGHFIPNENFVSYISLKYKSKMEEISKSVLSLGTPIFVEKKLSMPSSEDYKVEGVIDLILRDENGKDIIVDFKTGKKYKNEVIKEKRGQFLIYSILNEEALKGETERFYYAFIKDEDLLDAFKDSDAKKEKEEYKTLIKQVNESIKEGDWKENDDESKCQGCEYKAICRKRMVIR